MLGALTDFYTSTWTDLSVHKKGIYLGVSSSTLYRGPVSDDLLALPREGTQALGYTGVPWHIAGSQENGN